MKRESIWTNELTEKLFWLIRSGVTSFEAAEALGVSRASVTNRAARLGYKFVRKPNRAGRRTNPKGIGHYPFTERCGEIMRAHGVKI